MNLFSLTALEFDLPTLLKKEKNLFVWSEIPIMDSKRAVNFYEYVFQTRLEKHDTEETEEYWFPQNNLSYGSPGSLVKGKNYIPSKTGSLVYLTIKNLDTALERVLEKGGKIIKGRTSIGKDGFIAVILDTEGNKIGIHSKN